MDENRPALLTRNQRKPQFPLLSMGKESAVWLTRTRWPSSWPQGFSSIGHGSWLRGSILTFHSLPK